MLTLTLSMPERQQLEATFKTTADRRLRERCQAILMVDRQRRHSQVGQDVGVSPRTIQRWLNASAQGGLEGLTIRWAPGRTPHIPETVAPEILTWIKAGPAGCNLDRANWTYAELATYLSQTKGIAVSETTMRTFCTTQGVRPSRPTSRSLTGDPHPQAVARQELAAVKKSRGRRTRPVESRCSPFFPDPDAADHLGAQRASAAGGQSGLSGVSLCLRGPQRGERAVNDTPGGASTQDEKRDPVETAPPPTGVCTPFAGHCSGLPGGPISLRRTGDRPCTLAQRGGN